MKKVHIILVLMLILAGETFSQKNILTQDPKNGKPMLVGSCERKSLMTPDFSEWWNKEYNNYIVDTKTLDSLKDLMKHVTVTLVMGTWCGDSKREVPRFYKIADYLKFKYKRKMKVFCVDRDKKAGQYDLSEYKVQYVPTFIVYRDKAEIGRIIEQPVESLEKDLLKMLRQGNPSDRRQH